MIFKVHDSIFRGCFPEITTILASSFSIIGTRHQRCSNVASFSLHVQPNANSSLLLRNSVNLDLLGTPTCPLHPRLLILDFEGAFFGLFTHPLPFQLFYHQQHLRWSNFESVPMCWGSKAALNDFESLAITMDDDLRNTAAKPKFRLSCTLREAGSNLSREIFAVTDNIA